MQTDTAQPPAVIHGGRRWLRRGALAALAAVAVPLAIACGGDDGDDPTTTASAGASPGASATSDTAGPTATAIAAELPKDPGTYATTLYTAWSEGDDVRVEVMTSEAARQTLGENPFDPAEDFRVQSCAAGAETTACLWRGFATELTITVNNSAAQNGAPHAVTAVAFTPRSATIPSVPSDYAAALVTAWREGNADRVAQLATDDVAATLAARPPETGEAWAPAGCEGAAGSSYCTFETNAERLIVRVQNEAASQAQPDAVIEVRFEPLSGAAIPSVPSDYAAALVTAWSEGDDARVGQLAADEVVASLAARPAEEGEVWEPVDCEGAAGSSYCTFQTETERLIVRVLNETASQAQPDAVIEVRFEDR